MATRKQSNPAPALGLFAGPDDRQPTPLAQVKITPYGWALADRLALVDSLPSAASQNGSHLAALAKRELARIDAEAAARRAAQDEQNSRRRY